MVAIAKPNCLVCDFHSPYRGMRVLYVRTPGSSRYKPIGFICGNNHVRLVRLAEHEGTPSIKQSDRDREQDELDSQRVSGLY